MLNINQYKAVFWDFDGVIKESVEVKERAFVKLFSNYGQKIADRVRKHHIDNGGVSRFEKFKIYLQWVGEDVNEKKIMELSNQFSKLVLQSVIDAPWVLGVEKVLRTKQDHQLFILVSATPQDELMVIINKLELGSCFKFVFGAPIDKISAIKRSLELYDIDSTSCLMIGDAETDLVAARTNDITFLLRKHESNTGLLQNYQGDVISDFTKY